MSNSAVIRKSSRNKRADYVSGLGADERLFLEKQLAQQIGPHMGAAGVLASYVAVGAEISPYWVEEWARQANWTIVYPKVTGGPLNFHVTTRNEMQAGFKNIPEPRSDSPLIQPNIVLVPLIVADTQGNRIGQGGGHYDRTLQHLRQQGPVRTIGCCWDIQIWPETLSAERWDQPLDALATPTAFHLFDHASKQPA